MTHARMLDFPGSTTRLQRDVEDSAANHRDLAELALKAAFTFSNNLCVPLSMEISTAYWEDEFDLPVNSPSRPSEFAMLRRRTLPAEVEARPYWLHEQVFMADDIDFPTTSRFVTDFLATAPGDAAGMVIGWQEMQFNSTMARLPDGFLVNDDSVVPLEVGSGVVDHPVERFKDFDWVYGPMGTSVIHAPFEYRIHRDPGLVIFDVSVYWSTWVVGGAGYPDVADGIDALLDDGWERA